MTMDNYRQTVVLIEGLYVILCVSYSEVIALIIPKLGKMFIFSEYIKDSSHIKTLNTFFQCTNRERLGMVKSGEIIVTDEKDLINLIHNRWTENLYPQE